MLRDFEITLNIKDVELRIDSEDEIKFDLDLKKGHAYNKIYNAIQKQILNDDGEIYNEILESEKEYNG